MHRKLFLILIGVCFKTSLILGQNAQNTSTYKIITFLKQYKLDSVKHYLDKNQKLTNAFFLNLEYQYQKNGKKQLNISLNDSLTYNYLDSVIFYNYLGDSYIRRFNKNYTKAFGNYLNAITIAKKHADTLLINESLRRINKYFLYKNRNIELNKFYVNELEIYRKDSIDLFWTKYYTSMFKMSSFNYPFSKLDKEKIENNFQSLNQFTPNHPFFKGLYIHTLGIGYSTNDKHDLAKKQFEHALTTYNDNDYYSYSRKIDTEIALAVVGFYEKDFREAIPRFKASLKNKHIDKSEVLKHLVYDWLYKIYDTLKVTDSAFYYLELKNKTSEKIQYYETIESVKQIDTKFKVKEKNIAISNLNLSNKSLQIKMLSILYILSLAIILLIIIYYLYKRYKNKSTKLEEEQSETLKKIDELKQIVIKNHIVLKDHTKIYVADLLYIKSDDHYLNLFLSNGKNHFVRGKLNTIIDQLPPNFVRCHRSHIVNRNFVKKINPTFFILTDQTEIPISRNFKNDL